MNQQTKSTSLQDARVIFSATELFSIREEIRGIFALSLERADLDVWFDGSLVEGRVHEEMRLSTPDRTLDLHLEAFTEIDSKDAEELVDSRVHVLEFLLAMLEEWVEDGALRSPNLDWETFTYEARTILYRGAMNNAHAESMADEFLRARGVDPERLVEPDVEDWELQALDEDTEDDSDPRS